MITVSRPHLSITVLVFQIAISSSNARGISLVPKCENDSMARAYAELIHQAAVIGKDDRKPITKVAKDLGLSPDEVQQIRKTVGFVVCPGKKFKNPASATGFLVGNSHKLSTVGHVFKDKKTGKFREPLSECIFQNQNVPPETFKLQLADDGSDLIVGSESLFSGGADYAYANLKTDVPNAKAIRIDSVEKELKRGDEFIAISAFQARMKNPDLTQPIAQKCEVRDVGYYRSTTIKSTCDTYGGASGSPVITRDKDGLLTIRGMLTSDGGYTKDGEEFDLSNGNYAFGIGFDGKPFSMLQEFVSN